MVDLKFAKRLKHDLTAIKPVKTHEQVANEIHMAPSALSNLKTGRRSATRDVKQSLVRALGSFKLAMSAARSEFGTISYLNDHKLRLDDPYVVDFIQHKEEQERIQAYPDFKLASAKEKSERTAEDWAKIRNFIKQWVEEYGSEGRAIPVLAAYAGLSEEEFQNIVDDYNRQYGG